MSAGNSVMMDRAQIQCGDLVINNQKKVFDALHGNCKLNTLAKQIRIELANLFFLLSAKFL